MHKEHLVFCWAQNVIIIIGRCSREGRKDGREHRREDGREDMKERGREGETGEVGEGGTEGTDPIIHIGVCRPMSVLTGKDLQVDRT